MKICKNCKAELEDNQNFCHKCGRKQLESADNYFSKNNDSILDTSCEASNSNIVDELKNTINIESDKNIQDTNSKISYKKSVVNDNKLIIIIVSIVVCVFVVFVSIYTAVMLNSSDEYEQTSKTNHYATTQGNEKTTKNETTTERQINYPTVDDYLAVFDDLEVAYSSFRENDYIVVKYNNLYEAQLFLNEDGKIKSIITTAYFSKIMGQDTGQVAIWLLFPCYVLSYFHNDNQILDKFSSEGVGASTLLVDDMESMAYKLLDTNFDYSGRIHGCKFNSTVVSDIAISVWFDKGDDEHK